MKRWLLALALSLAVVAPVSAQDVYRVMSSMDSAPEAVYQQIDNVVRVQASDGGGVQSWGSGVYLGCRYVLTAAHVVRDGRTGIVHFRDGTRISFRTVKYDGTYDQAVLEMSRHHPTLAGSELAGENAKPNDLVVAAGYDSGQPILRLRPGLAAAYYRPQGAGAPDWFEMDNRVQSGSSGGPVFTREGRVLGNLWGANRSGTMAVNCGRTRRFLLPWNARLQAWRLWIRGGRRGAPT